jgi:hypothetical protein
MRGLLLSALLFGTPWVASASDGLSSALAARSLLGAKVWARPVRIGNTESTREFARSPYPREVYGLVFELSGILWFYCDSNGTQSLSRRTGSLAADKADPGPLFLAIDRGFTRWSWVNDQGDPARPSLGVPPNACFIESVAALFRRVAAGGQADAPRLLSYYVDTPSGWRGHTVLVFGDRAGLAALDPEFSGRPVRLPSILGQDPKAWSAYLRGGPIVSARTLAVESPTVSESSDQWASLPRKPVPAG